MLFELSLYDTQTTVKLIFQIHLEFSNDTKLSSLSGKDDASIHQYCSDRLVEWCERHSLIIYAKSSI